MCIYNRAPVEAQDDDVIAGLLWSDPVARDGIFPSTRGIGVFFGPDVTKRFLGMYKYCIEYIY
jgi:hypothetical protein